MDLLGFGKSPKPGCSGYDLAAQLRSIEATLDSLAITEPFTLVGHSMGSLISLRYASEHPASIKKLLLTNMPVFASVKEVKSDIYSTRKLYKIALQPGVHGFIWPFFKLFMQLRLLPEHLTGNMKDHRQYMFQSTGISRIRSMRNLIFTAKVEADLRALEVATVLLSGFSDRAPYLKNLQAFRLNQNVALQTVVGGHHLPQTNPSLIARLV